MEPLPADTSYDSPNSHRKPRTCPHCKRHFRRHEHLQRHIRIHTNEKPYPCRCGASFARRDLLKRHQLITHGGRQSTPEGHSQTIQSGIETPHQIHPNPRTDLWDLSDVQANSTGSMGPQAQLPPLLDAYDPLQDFESFSSSMGLALDWTLPFESNLGPPVARDTGFSGIPTAPSRSSSDQPEQSLTQLPAERDSIGEFCVLTLPVVKITDEHRNRLLQPLAKIETTLSGSLLPSCHSLTRFVNAFFDGFYPNMPIVHLPTFDIDDCEPMIVLAMAALGSQYRHEHRKGVLLWYAAKAILQEQVHERERRIIDEKILSRSGSHPSSAEVSPNETAVHTESFPYKELMSQARCALYLIAFATWQREPDVVREAFNLQSFLARCVRESGLEETPETLQTPPNWHTWVQQESYRRIKLFSFALLNLQSIAFNVAPILLSDEIHIRLPCSCIEWLAPDHIKWSRIHHSSQHTQMLFQDALTHLMRGPSEQQQLSSNPDSSQPVPSPLANWILQHALIQRIMLIRWAFHSTNSEEETPLLSSQKDTIRNALRAWTFQWQRAPESSLDPRNPNGPIPFTSTALLGLAYVRLAFNMGPYRILESRDPVQIANRLLQLPRLPPGPHLLPSILHAAHALSIPVKIGLDFASRSHSFVWNIQHSLCGLEFAVFLSKWLHCISETRTKRSLDEHETRLINWISDIVEEGRTSGDVDISPTPASPFDCPYLAYLAVKLWARLIKGNEQWAILRVIGESLDIYADLCRDRYRHSDSVNRNGVS